jgi:hypothetical protein
MEFAEPFCLRQMGPGRDRHTIKEPIGGDLTSRRDALLPFQSQFQGGSAFSQTQRRPESRYNFQSVVPLRPASSIETFQHVQASNRE